jgi:predicted Co/Zn/Cd cation transporter (cation efflux family)
VTDQVPPYNDSSVAKSDFPSPYRAISICMAVVFAIVGLIFLFMPGSTLRLFNDLSTPLGFEPSPVGGISFYLILAVGYMYVVTLIAWLMARQPENRTLPLLLVNAKLASSVLSFVFFLGFHQSLIFLVNGVVDGIIGLGVFYLYRNQRSIA